MFKLAPAQISKGIALIPLSHFLKIVNQKTALFYFEYQHSHLLEKIESFYCPSAMHYNLDINCINVRLRHHRTGTNAPLGQKIEIGLFESYSSSNRKYLK